MYSALLAPGDRAQPDVVRRAPFGLGRERERHELGDMPVARCRERAPAVQQGQLEEVTLGEIALGELLGLRPARRRSQGLEPSDLVDHLAQQFEPVGTVDLERGQHREVVDASDRAGHRLERPATRDRQVHAEVPDLMAETDRLDPGLPAHRARQAGHGIRDVEQPRVGAVFLHRLADADQDGDVAQRPIDPARTDRVAHSLGDAVPGGHVEVDRHGAKPAGRDAHDHEVRSVERGAEVGRGGDGGLGAHRVTELVRQRLHLGQRGRVDVLEHEVHPGERRGAEEIGHQFGCPLVAAAADDRHLGAHAATVQSRS
jgi:hypothetical protein